MFLERRRASLRIPETGVETSTGVGLTMLLGLEHRLEKKERAAVEKRLGFGERERGEENESSSMKLLEIIGLDERLAISAASLQIIYSLVMV
jgi:hypothetical protein